MNTNISHQPKCNPCERAIPGAKKYIWLTWTAIFMKLKAGTHKRLGAVYKRHPLKIPKNLHPSTLVRTGQTSPLPWGRTYFMDNPLSTAVFKNNISNPASFTLTYWFWLLNFKQKHCTAAKTNCNLHSQNKQMRQLFNYDVISQYTKNTILRFTILQFLKNLSLVKHYQIISKDLNYDFLGIWSLNLFFTKNFL